MRKVLEPTFFNRPSYVVAKDLLGKFLVRNINMEVGKKLNNLSLGKETGLWIEDRGGKG